MAAQPNVLSANACTLLHIQDRTEARLAFFVANRASQTKEGEIDICVCLNEGEGEGEGEEVVVLLPLHLEGSLKMHLF